VNDEYPRGERAKKNMKKKITVLTLWAMLLALCASAEAQQPARIPRIGILAGASNEGKPDPHRHGGSGQRVGTQSSIASSARP
jgi:hypothetical protein